MIRFHSREPPPDRMVGRAAGDDEHPSGRHPSGLPAPSAAQHPTRRRVAPEHSHLKYLRATFDPYLIPKGPVSGAADSPAAGRTGGPHARVSLLSVLHQGACGCHSDSCRDEGARDGE